MAPSIPIITTMVPSTSTCPSPSFPSSIEKPQQWANRISKTFQNHLLVDTDLPVCIFQVPDNFTTEKPESYIPQTIGLGPIHHFQTQLYSKREQLKLETAKTMLKPYKITSDFTEIVIETLKQLIPEVRCCYDLYFDFDDDTLAWVYALDGLFSLDLLSKVSEGDSLESFEDLVKVENQIPLVVLIEVRTALEEHLSGDCNHSFLTNSLIRICETRSPLKFSRRITRLDLDINSRLHLLDCMYHLIINHNVAKNQFQQNNFLDDIDMEDIENAVQMAGDLCPGANAFLQPLLLIMKLPWDKIIGLIKKMMGENPAVLEIDIPSASQLSRIGKVEFCMTPGGIGDVEFDDETCTFYLPILSLKSDSEVMLRNLVVYEGLMFKKGTFTNLDFTEYVDLMCGIIDGVKDVRILREKHIIEGDLDDEEIVKLFNGITKSSLKNEEASGLQKTVARVNKHFGNVPRVKAYHFVKKYFLAWWKVIAMLFTLLNLMLLLVEGACQVYECNNRVGFGIVRLLFGAGGEKNRLFDY